MKEPKYFAIVDAPSEAVEAVVGSKADTIGLIVENPFLPYRDAIWDAEGINNALSRASPSQHFCNCEGIFHKETCSMYFENFKFLKGMGVE